MPPYVNDFYLRQPNYQYGSPYPQNFPPQQTPQIKTYFVTGIEEARAAMIDPLATNVFFDTSCGKIYLKNMGNDGRPQFVTYTVEEQQVPKDPIAEINSRLTNIEKTLGGIRNDKSISGNAGVYKSEQISQPAVTGAYEPDGSAESSSLS